MSPTNTAVLLERKQQEANALRMKAYRKRAYQLITPDDAQILMWLRELRLGKEARR